MERGEEWSREKRECVGTLNKSQRGKGKQEGASLYMSKWSIHPRLGPSLLGSLVYLATF